MYEFNGTHRSVGFQIGRMFAEQIHYRIEHDPEILRLLDFIKNEPGESIIDDVCSSLLLVLFPFVVSSHFRFCDDELADLVLVVEAVSSVQ